LDAASWAASNAAAQEDAARQRLASAQANVEQAQSALATARSGVSQATARRNQARAAVQQAQASYQSAQTGIQTAQAKVRQAQAGVEQARTGLSGLQADVSQQQAKVAEAAANLQGTSAAPQKVSVSQAQAQTALARVEQARAKVEELQLQLSYTKIVAPHDGIISGKNVSEGQTIQIGQPLMNVTDLSAADIIANFKETQLTGIHVGSKAEFTVDAYPGRVFQGHVSSLSPGTGAVFSLLPPENATGNFTKIVQRVPVKVAIDSGEDATHPLRMGMSVIVTVTTGS
jgi:membrane fusion protein (multidrug efflux system)